MSVTKKERYIWIDSVKLFACILVVLGHLYMSMAAGGWISEEAWYYCWPIQTIYTFHVPLFFVCSGFLYQSKKIEWSFAQYKETIKTKVIVLGVPYFTFSIITLVLKTIFAEEVNNQAPPFFRTLFLEPVAPYWYLYTLFFLFCFIPRFNNVKHLRMIFAMAVIIKVLYVVIPETSVLPDIITKTANNAIWFLLGMLLTEKQVRIKFQYKNLALVMFVLAIIISVTCYRQNNSSSIIQFILAVLFIYSLLAVFLHMKYDKVECNIVKWNQYFMPIYLMHTIFAAGIRIVLSKIGVSGLLLNFTFGMFASIVFPIVIYEFAKKFWVLLFWIEPLKAIQVKEKKHV